MSLEAPPTDLDPHRPDSGGSALLTELADLLGSFVAFPSPEARDAVALWVVHAHAVEAAETTARLSIRSAEKQSGKTRLLEVLELVVPRPLAVVNISVAALFRSIGEPPPTLLHDEIDAVFKGNDPAREDLRALLNAGYRRGAKVLRVAVEGRRIGVSEFSAFAPAALAGIGDLPDTLSDRSIIVVMRRRRPDEVVRSFRRREVVPVASVLRMRLEGWASRNHAALKVAWPAVPPELSDRAADLWEPLIAISDLAGGPWPERARAAAVALHAIGRERDRSLGVRLLADIKGVFAAHADLDALPTRTLLKELVELDESPWGSIHGRPLSDRDLASLLRPYDVSPALVYVPPGRVRGYRRAAFSDAWARYLPGPPDSVLSVPAVQSQVDRQSVVGADAVGAGADGTDRTVGRATGARGPLPPSVATVLTTFPGSPWSTGQPRPGPTTGDGADPGAAWDPIPWELLEMGPDA